MLKIPTKRKKPPKSADGSMSVVDHLRELRSRMVKAVIIVLVGAIAGWFWYDHGLLAFLQEPYCNLPAHLRFPPGAGCKLIILDPTGGLMLRIKVSFIAGIVVSAPFWLYQLWAFITPGLKKNERRWAIAFVLVSTTLFAMGAVCAYFTLKAGLRILLSLAGSGIAAQLTAPEYIGFVTSLLLVFGVSFELPLIVVMLNLVRILKYETLKKSRRWLIFLTFVFAAIITPSQDPFSMNIMAVPMVLLFEGAIQFARIHDKRLAKRDKQSAFPDDLDDDEPSPLELRSGTEAEDYQAGSIR